MQARLALLPVALLMAAALCVPLAGAEEEREQGQLASPTLHGKLALSIADAVAMGLKNNLDLEVQRFAPVIALQDAEGAWGAYDPEAFAEFGYDSLESPNANALLTNPDEDPILVDRKTSGEGGFRGLLPYLGATYEISLEGERRATNSTFQTLSPQLQSRVTVGANVPLLKDLIWNEPWTRVKTTKSLYRGSQEDFRTEVMNTVDSIERAYWELIATEESERVAVKSLETARALLDQTQTQYEVGVVSKVEVFEAEAGVAEREVNLIRAENAYRTSQDRLIDLVLGTGLTAGSRLEIEPTDRPEDYVTYQIDVEEAVAKAFGNRPELQVAARAIETRQLELKFAKNQRLPRFDVEASYGYSGIAGDQRDDVPGDLGFGTGFGDTFDDYLKEQGADSLTVRGLFSIPIPNTTARRRVSRSEFELRRARTRRTRLEQSIVLEVRQAARDLESAQQGIGAAERRVMAASEQLRAERIRLEHGESTPFDVLERERDLVDAESEEIGALRLYRTSVTGLDRAQGTILKTRNIVIDEVAALR